MSRTITLAPIRKTIRVKAPIAYAFEVFTSGLTRWWPHDHGVGKRPIAKVLMEPRLGGRWLEISKDGTETPVATITHWEPPHRVVIAWKVNPDAAAPTEIEVRFSPEGDVTRVELVHHKFETMGAEAGASMRRDVDRGWPGLIARFVAEAERNIG